MPFHVRLSSGSRPGPVFCWAAAGRALLASATSASADRARRRTGSPAAFAVRGCSRSPALEYVVSDSLYPSREIVIEPELPEGADCYSDTLSVSRGRLCGQSRGGHKLVPWDTARWRLRAADSAWSVDTALLQRVVATQHALEHGDDRRFRSMNRRQGLEVLPAAAEAAI